MSSCNIALLKNILLSLLYRPLVVPIFPYVGHRLHVLYFFFPYNMNSRITVDAFVGSYFIISYFIAKYATSLPTRRRSFI